MRPVSRGVTAALVSWKKFRMSAVHLIKKLHHNAQTETGRRSVVRRCYECIDGG